MSDSEFILEYAKQVPAEFPNQRKRLEAIALILRQVEIIEEIWEKGKK